MNENYVHPGMPDNVEADIVRGLYRLKQSTVTGVPVVQLLGAGAILREVEDPMMEAARAVFQGLGASGRG